MRRSSRTPQVFLNFQAYTFAMTERSIELLQKALSLTEEERADLAASLLNSLDASPDPGVEALWQEEISRRVSALDSGQAKTIPWQEVQSQLSAALQHSSKSR
jgi:putative addiction module component (TIGR02574 family)